MTKAKLIVRLLETSPGHLILRVLIKSRFANFAKLMESAHIRDYMALVGQKNSMKLCDIGCGCGEWCSELSAKGHRVWGIDPDEEALESARLLSTAEKTPAVFVGGSAEALPFETEFFDLVLSVCAIEHFADEEKAMAEISRVLKAGGTLVLTADSFSYGDIGQVLKKRHTEMYHVNRYYSIEGLGAKLAENGFAVNRSRYFINSQPSAWFLKLLIRFPRLSLMLFPIAYPLSLVGDRLFGNQSKGFLIALLATKVANSPQCAQSRPGQLEIG